MRRATEMKADWIKEKRDEICCIISKKKHFCSFTSHSFLCECFASVFPSISNMSFKSNVHSEFEIESAHLLPTRLILSRSLSVLLTCDMVIMRTAWNAKEGNVDDGKRQFQGREKKAHFRFLCVSTQMRARVNKKRHVESKNERNERERGKKWNHKRMVRTWQFVHSSLAYTPQWQHRRRWRPERAIVMRNGMPFASFK